VRLMCFVELFGNIAYATTPFILVLPMFSHETEQPVRVLSWCLNL
jgi:hypothetical protein